jgi:hypothetical protein
MDPLLIASLVIAAIVIAVIFFMLGRRGEPSRRVVVERRLEEYDF